MPSHRCHYAELEYLLVGVDDPLEGIDARVKQEDVVRPISQRHRGASHSLRC